MFDLNSCLFVFLFNFKADISQVNYSFNNQARRCFFVVVVVLILQGIDRYICSLANLLGTPEGFL